MPGESETKKGAKAHRDGFHGETSVVSESIEETRRYHRLYLRAVNNPLRRKILLAIKEGYNSMNDIQKETGIDKTNLEWHLSILEHGFCVEKIAESGKLLYNLTKEGQLIEYLK